MKNCKGILFRLSIVILGILSFSLSEALAQNVSPVDPVSGVGSGSTRLGGTFRLDGIPGVGFFVGNPNKLSRNDRVILAFPLAGLPASGTNAKATLTLHVDYLVSDQESVELKVEQLRTETMGGEIGEEMLTMEDGVEMGRAAITSENEVRGGRADGAAIEIDVSKGLAEAMANGSEFVYFRLSSPDIEEKHNPDLKPEGFSVDMRSKTLPCLVVE